MAPQPPITEIDQLKDRPAVPALQAASLVESAKFDRDELTIFVNRADIRGACEILRENPATKYNFLADITCVDVFPSEPRFEVIYNLLSHSRKERLRLIAKVPGGDPSADGTVVRKLAGRRRIKDGSGLDVNAAVPLEEQDPPGRVGEHHPHRVAFQVVPELRHQSTRVSQGACRSRAACRPAAAAARK